MFNRSYQQRARKVTPDTLHLPWAGIFEPWRPLVMTAAAAETLAAKRCKKSSGRLQGVQLELFADRPPIQRKSPADTEFPLLAGLEVPMADDERPLADIFPEAYV